MRLQLSKDNPHLNRCLEGAKAGERKAQKAIYDALADKMFAVCIRYMGDRQQAEDVLQDGFVTLFTKLGSFLGEGSFEGWARRIFVNTALMALRKKDVLRQSEDVEEAFGMASDTPPATAKLGYNELLKLVATLPPGLRTVFNLYVIEGYSHKDIGQILGIEEVTSRSQLQRARMMLQKKIRQNEY